MGYGSLHGMPPLAARAVPSRKLQFLGPGSNSQSLILNNFKLIHSPISNAPALLPIRKSHFR
jgi:hypothetical protein